MDKSVGKGQETFQEFARRRGPDIVKEVARQAIEAGATESARGQEDLAVADAAAIEALDEMQIAEELRGRILSQFFYEFESKGRTVTGLSISGVKSIARTMALHGEPISIVGADMIVGEDSQGEWIGCTVHAKNLRTGEERVAYSSQYTMMNLKSGERIPDPFARTKALNKAQRNALRWFIPEVVISEAYKEWKKGGGVDQPSSRIDQRKGSGANVAASTSSSQHG